MMETYIIRHIDGPQGDLTATVKPNGGIVITDAQGLKRNIPPRTVGECSGPYAFLEKRYRTRKSDKFWWRAIEEKK